MQRLTFFLLLFSVVFANAFPALGQQAKSAAPVIVKVTDPTGAVIAHARVKVTALPKELETDSQGKLSLDLPPGSYNFLITEQGFNNFTKAVVVPGSEAVTVNASLQISGGGPVVVRDFNWTPEERSVWQLEVIGST